MKKIVTILWHQTANRFRLIKSELNKIADISIYSSSMLDDGKESIDTLYEEIEKADILVFNETVANPVWKEINEFIKEKNKKIVYIGTEAAQYIRTSEQAIWSMEANKYFSYSGAKNICNMFKYLCATILNQDIEYEKPDPIPWDAIYDPYDKSLYSSAQEYFEKYPQKNKGTIAVIVSRSAWVNDDMNVENLIVSEIIKTGYDVLPIYSYTMSDSALGTKGTDYAIEEFCIRDDGVPYVDGIIRLAGIFERGACERVANKLKCPVIKPICSYSMTIEEWKENDDGTLVDVPWSVALPELDGVIEPIFIGAQEKDGIVEQRAPLESRVKKLVIRMENWITLKKMKNSDKKIVFMLNNNPCTSTEASVGGGANLDSLESVVRIMQQMKREGYTIENIPKNGDDLIRQIMGRKAISDFRWTTTKEIVHKGGAIGMVDKKEYDQWFEEIPKSLQESMISTWGAPIGEAMVYDNKIVITGIQFGNVIVCVQPKRGCAGSKCDGTVCKFLHEPHIPPTHQYFATYRWFEKNFGANALIHVGTHGNLEFLPGKAVGLSDACAPDACIGNMPLLYIYNADNPPEATIAKRRAMAVTVNHMQTTMITGGLYDELEQLQELLNQYEKTKRTDMTQAHLLEHIIVEEIQKSSIAPYINLENYHDKFDTIVEQCHKQLSLISNTQIQDGMHIFGDIPESDKLVDMIYSILRYDSGDKKSIRRDIASIIGVDFSDLLENPQNIFEDYNISFGQVQEEIDQIGKNIVSNILSGEEINSSDKIWGRYSNIDILDVNNLKKYEERILSISKGIKDSKEIKSLISGLDGEHISAGPSGVIARGREDILPTGRNMYSLDPNKIPMKAAWEIGKRLSDKVIEKYFQEENKYPESMAFYWMAADIMWSDGEGLAQILYLLGVKPKWNANGRVNGFEIIPLSELKRPRIDVTVKISGILRDNFQDCIYLLDDAIRAVANLNEPEEENFVRKHTLEMMKKNDIDNDDAATRIFGVKPGTYSSGVNLLIYSSAWDEKKDIGDLFALYNQYSYSRKSYGKPSMNTLVQNLSTVEITYDKVVSDEHDLLGCCCYFANHGGMTAAAEEYSKKNVKKYYGDTREATNVSVRTLEEEIGRVVSSKLLNPKWIEGQKAAGYKGAADISKRIGRVYGWDASTDAVDDSIFDNITKTFISNDENREFFMDQNPWALEEMTRRLIEANKRGLWEPEDGLMDDIQEAYLELEGLLEDDMGMQTGEYQGGDINITSVSDLEIFQENISKLHKLKNNK